MQEIERVPNLAAQAKAFRMKMLEEGREDQPFDMREFMESHLKIVTKQGELVNLKFNKVQEILWEKILDMERRGVPLRFIINKIRQTGVSTLFELFIGVKLHIIPYLAAIVVAHEKENARWLYRMNVIAYENLPLEMIARKPLTSEKPKLAELVYASPHHSILSVGTGFNVNRARSLTLGLVHLSEAAYYRDLEGLLGAVNQAVPDEPGTLVAIESTPNGRNAFYNECKRAMKGESEYEYVFISLKDFEKYYSTPLLPGERLELTPDMAEFQKKHKLSNAQMKWVVHIFKGKCLGQWPIFNREYPASTEVAFDASSALWFQIQTLNKMEDKYVRDPIKRGGLKWISDQRHSAVEFEEYKWGQGSVEVWEEPLPDADYLIAIDIAEGKFGDYTVAHVCKIIRINEKIANLEQVAKYRTNRENLESQTLTLWQLGTWYNWAYVAIETNNQGLSIARDFENGYAPASQTEGGYPHLYYQVRIRQKEDKPTANLGWLTYPKSKEIMLGEISPFVENGRFIFHSEHTLRELGGFSYDQAARTWIQEYRDPVTRRYHDDEVMAAAIAPQALKEWLKKTRLFERPATWSC